MSFGPRSLAPNPVVGVHTDFPFCWWCLEEFWDEPPLATCPYCWRLPYCSRKCQQYNWNCHKPDCVVYQSLSPEERVRGDERLQQITDQHVHGVAEFPPLTPDIDPPWGYFQRLSKVQIFRILADLFLETIRWENEMLSVGFTDVDGGFIVTEFGNDREAGFRGFLERARDADILPGRWSRRLFGQCERFALDQSQVRTIHSNVSDLELERYYGKLAYEGFHEVFIRLFPQMSEADWDVTSEDDIAGYCELAGRR